VKSKIARVACIPAAAAAALSLAGCAGDSLSAATVESGIKTHLASAAPAAIKSTSCHNDLNAKVGASETCTLSLVTGQRYLVAVRVESVHGHTANYHIRVVKKLG
jgi:hypothetical protein